MALPIGDLKGRGPASSLASRAPGGTWRTCSGFSLVEILVTMSIMLALTTTATMYYGVIVPEQRIGRAKTDIQQFKKAVGYLKSHYRCPLTSDVFRFEEDGPPWPDSLTPYHPDQDAAGEDPALDKLLKFSIVPRLTPDPWGQDYRIDVQNGWIYSSGPDGVAHRGSDLQDDIVDSYQPPFLPLRARLSGSYLEIEFSREVSRRIEDARRQLRFQLTKENFGLVSSPARAIETAVVDVSTPFIVKLRLADSSARPSQVQVIRDPPGGTPTASLRSSDGALLSTAQMVLTTTSTSGAYYLPGP
ncbi:MAG: prepilin-type N-terminal cleavage/methylation domain-containing protein [Candidatus Riflebacteria bacterium]|nr:prepilin-type N-terminal cleavage/methylation domain-containing protein [Candidatus Riflebacteria bacterium]